MRGLGTVRVDPLTPTLSRRESGTAVLILGGTTEASAIARALAGDARFRAVLSLAGRTRAPVAPPVPWRSGGFGGAEGLAGYLRDSGVEALVDATHPFAARISANAVQAAGMAGVPHLAVLRPAWEAVAGDRWTAVPEHGGGGGGAWARRPRRVLLTVGQQELAPFLGAPGHDYLIRSVEPPPAALLPPGARVLTARGPFALADELALMRREGIEVVVTKNSGGAATAAKLAAARALGVEVVMVARPPPRRAPCRTPPRRWRGCISLPPGGSVGRKARAVRRGA